MKLVPDCEKGGECANEKTPAFDQIALWDTATSTPDACATQGADANATRDWTRQIQRANFSLFHPMPQFSYRARDAQGSLVEGVLNVADRSVAIRQIEQQNCTPIRIEAMVGRAAVARW